MASSTVQINSDDIRKEQERNMSRNESYSRSSNNNNNNNNSSTRDNKVNNRSDIDPKTQLWKEDIERQENKAVNDKMSNKLDRIKSNAGKPIGLAIIVFFVLLIVLLIVKPPIIMKRKNQKTSESISVSKLLVFPLIAALIVFISPFLKKKLLS